MEKTFACRAFLCLLFLNAIYGAKCAVVKQCEQDIQLAGCNDKKCIGACQQKFHTTKSAFCLPNKKTCECYYTCDNGPVVDCSENINLDGCDNAKCFAACVGKVNGAVSGTCLPGNHVCECDIPC